MKTKALRPAPLSARMWRWRMENHMKTRQASLLCNCTDEAWRDWENGASISEWWRGKIEAVIRDGKQKA